MHIKAFSLFFLFVRIEGDKGRTKKREPCDFVTLKFSRSLSQQSY